MATQRPIFEKKNVLITGGAGFLGSHLCELLLKDAKVICVDNFLTGNLENINHLLQYPDFKFIRHDVTKPIDLERFDELEVFKISFQGVQEVYHLASPTSPRDYVRYPIETLLANAFGTKHALDVAEKYNAKFMLFSSAAIYGEPIEDKPIPEIYWGFLDPLADRSVYGEGKRFAENLTFQYRKLHNFDAKIVRIFNAYGPGMKLDDGRMIPEFIHRALMGKSIVITAKPNTKITFCYVSDIMDGVMKFIRTSESGPVNMGGVKEYTIEDVARLIIKMCESRSEVIYEESRQEFSRQPVPDLAFAKERLGWLPVTSLEDGLTQTIAYMKGRKSLDLGAN